MTKHDFDLLCQQVRYGMERASVLGIQTRVLVDSTRMIRADSRNTRERARTAISLSRTLRRLRSASG